MNSKLFLIKFLRAYKSRGEYFSRRVLTATPSSQMKVGDFTMVQLGIYIKVANRLSNYL